MLFYLAIIAISTLFAAMANLKKENNNVSNILYLISAVILFIPLALRDCGVDYEVYQRTYYSTANLSWTDYWRLYNGRPEPLYAVLNCIASKIFHSFQWVNILCALLSIHYTYAGIYQFKDTLNLGISVWSFGFTYYIMMYGLNRMMIAVSLVTWAYHYWIEKKTVKYIIWIVI